MKTTIIQDEACIERKFHLSELFTVTRVSYSRKGYTFFHVEYPYAIPDGKLEFHPSYMINELGCSRCKTGGFYLYGIWKFTKREKDNGQYLWSAVRCKATITIEFEDV